MFLFHNERHDLIDFLCGGLSCRGTGKGKARAQFFPFIINFIFPFTLWIMKISNKNTRAQVGVNNGR